MPNLHALAFRPDGRMLAVAGGAPGQSGTVQLRAWPSGRLQRTLTGHRDLIMAMAFGPDGKRLATGSADHTIRVWDLEGGGAARVLTGHAGPVLAVAFSPDGRWLASGSADHSVKLWDGTTGQLQRTLAQHTGAVTALAFAPGGRLLASAGTDQTARVWQPEIGRLVRTLRHDAPLHDLAWASCGIVTAAADGRVRLLASETGSLLHTFPTVPGPIYALAVRPDGGAVAAGGVEGTIRLWPLATAASSG
jgi:WD40 repeat protein